MEKKDIEHLANLARIELSEEEKTELTESITDILGYVSQVQDIAASEKEKKAEGLYNVMREDEPSHEPGEYTDAILKSAPKTKGPYIEVKKILGGGSEESA
jgi:aspartyl-tRNA(Asn)/glutamyl-tRNA(Gln) amidotransferase subunit C